ncbi:hypothetical protein BV25DRAFT_1870331 [Artomyces pyxidatus]|uniref:Uncharacterized protein n=1 Tax=Artomyces pyxidatus TaxID=48021 RepID=A0ACB8T254_9AGAM|nr:hypothetical protein BV25DRAFT_1870331 [Artomyces pyxidatus]
MSFIWDLWMTHSDTDDLIHIDTQKAREFGELIPKAMSTLPSSFCGVVRDPFLKRQSQYKIYEWMALLHWYIIPIGIELGFDTRVLANFAEFVQIIEFAMTVKERSDEDLHELHLLINNFLQGYELLYVQNDPEKVLRSIGELGRKIRSKKEPFVNLANILWSKEAIKILLLRYPFLERPIKVKPRNLTMKEFKIPKREYTSNSEFSNHLRLICQWLGKNVNEDIELRRWGKYSYSQKYTLRSRLSEQDKDKVSRSARYFEAAIECDKGIQIEFGEAIAFYELVKEKKVVVVYHPLDNRQKILSQWRGTWSSDIKVLPASAIQTVVGIWSHKNRVYVLRKHPGLDMLSAAESNRIEDNGEDSDNDE